MNLAKLIEDLCLLPGLSGHEQAVARYMRSHFESLGLECFEDVLGNVYTVLGNKESNFTVLLTAHMDQLGFMVKTITDDGFIKIERVGGIPEKTLSSLRVSIQNDKGELIPGVIGVKSHHITPPEEKYLVDKYQTLYIDTGCDCREEVLALGIDIGDPIIYRPHFEKLNNKRISGTSFDNRVPCAVLLELANRFVKVAPKIKVVLAGTVQEELTIRGATTVAAAVKPSVIFCLDVTMEGGTPDLQGQNHVHLGCGPVMSLYNFHGRGTLNGTIPHPALVKLVKETAADARINLQKIVMVGGLTELAYMQVLGTGIAGIDVDVPCRYTHSQVETADLDDVEKTVDLMEAVVNQLRSDFKITRSIY
jgi:putative aminopeptidase FrvX